jgi:hypothetical protein
MEVAGACRLGAVVGDDGEKVRRADTASMAATNSSRRHRVEPAMRMGGGKV